MLYTSALRRLPLWMGFLLDMLFINSFTIGIPLTSRVLHSYLDAYHRTSIQESCGIACFIKGKILYSPSLFWQAVMLVGHTAACSALCLNSTSCVPLFKAPA